MGTYVVAEGLKGCLSVVVLRVVSVFAVRCCKVGGGWLNILQAGELTLMLGFLLSGHTVSLLCLGWNVVLGGCCAGGRCGM